jgi:hypothetical protein
LTYQPAFTKGSITGSNMMRLSWEEYLAASGSGTQNSVEYLLDSKVPEEFHYPVLLPQNIRFQSTGASSGGVASASSLRVPRNCRDVEITKSGKLDHSAIAIASVPICLRKSQTLPMMAHNHKNHTASNLF